MCGGCVIEYANEEYAELGTVGGVMVRGLDVALEHIAARPGVQAAMREIAILYAIRGCSVGGPLHVVVDDTNVDDEFLYDDAELDRAVDQWAATFPRMGEEITRANVEHVRSQCRAVIDALRPLTLVERAAATVYWPDGSGA